MAKISRWILGYRKISCTGGETGRFVSIILKHGISAEFVSSTEFLVAERDYSKIKRDIEECGGAATKTLGFLGIIKSIKHKVAIGLAACLSLILIYLACNTVWDIRVESAGSLLESEIVYALNECGLSLGSFWNNIDNSEIEVEFLDKFPAVAWININRRGMVAYVTISEKDGDDRDDVGVAPAYANIVAAVDCVIEDICVTKGVARVKIGDTVKAGDILVSGITSEENGELCRAEGVITGRVVDSVSVNVNKEYREIVEIKEELNALAIKIFNFKTNIFRFYGNSADKCDIIEDKVRVSLFDKVDLPVEIISSYCISGSVVNKTLSAADMVRVASKRLNAAIASHIAGADLIGISTEGKFLEDRYTMTSKIVYLADVGICAEFGVN